MKPNEFYSSTYRDVFTWCEELNKQKEREIKSNIILFNNLGNKLIGAGLTVKKPKNINLITENYGELFEKELEQQQLYVKKDSEGEDLVNLMHELSIEINQKNKEV